MNSENHLTTRKQFRERITHQGVDRICGIKDFWNIWMAIPFIEPKA